MTQGTKRKRFLAALLSLAMLGTSAAVPVLAEPEDELPEAVEDIAAVGETEAVLQDEAEEIVFDAEEDFTENAFLLEETTPVEQEVKQYYTYSFENIDIVAHDISGLTNSVDYVTYYKDESIADYNWGQGPSTLSVPAGGRAVVTSLSGTIKVGYEDEYFLVEEEDHPVMNRVSAKKNEVYIYKNISGSVSKIFMTQDWYYYPFDYVMYDAEGNISSYEWSKTSSSMEVPAGYSIKIAPIGQSMRFAGLYDCFNIKKFDEPNFKKVYVQVGETSIFKNTSNVSYTLFMTSDWYYYPFDYVMYDAEGNINSYEWGKTTGSMDIPAGYSIKVTPVGQNMTFGAIYEKFDSFMDNHPVMKRVSLATGESFTYKNASNISYTLFMTSDWYYYPFDYTIYNANGSIHSNEHNKTSGSMEIPAGYSIKVTPTSQSMTFCGLYDIFNMQDSVAEKLSYKVTNSGTNDGVLKYKSGFSGDYAIYSSDGTLTSSGGSSNSDVVIPGGGYAFVTANAYEGLYPFEDNELLNVEERADQVYNTKYIMPDETYRFTNNGSRELETYINGLSFDYAIYNADGTVASYSASSTAASVSVPIGGSIRITSHNYIRVKCLYDYFTVEKQSEKVFESVLCSTDNTYQFENSFAKNMNLLVHGGLYDYVIYDVTGSVSHFGVNSDSVSLSVPSGSKCVITSRETNKIDALNGVFNVSERSYPVAERITAYIGKNVTAKNSSGNDRKLYCSYTDNIDYVTYDTYGEPVETKERTGATEITVPANGKVEIKANISNIIYAGLYEAFAEGDFSTKVTGITLSSETLTLAPNKQAVLKATVLPSDATNKTITWSSSNTKVATVAQTGKVTAKANGTAIITATTADGGYTASCTVTVSDGSTPVVTPTPTPVPGNGATVSVSSAAAAPGKTATVTVDLANNKGFANLGIQVSYDASVMTLTSAVSNTSVGAVYTPAQSISADPYNMGWDSTGNVTFNGTLATLTFAVSDSAADGDYPIGLSYYTGINGNYTDGSDVNYDADFKPLELNYIGGTITVSSHIPGDINGDGKVNNQDGTFLLRHLAGWNVSVDESALDVNGDSKINNQDGTILLRYLGGWSVDIR